MKLTFILANRIGESIAYQATGIMNTANKRSVTIKLTEKQIEQLNLKPMGKNHGKDYYEDIVEVFIEKGGDDETT